MNSGIRRSRHLLPDMRLGILLLLIISGALLSCRDSKAVFEQDLKNSYPRSVQLNNTAAFIAGMGIPETSPLHPLTLDPRYLKYQTYISRVWERYERKNLHNIETWRRQHLNSASRATVLYPFSGPDILNALAFYPDASEFIMIGLESPGSVPDISSMQASRVMSDLWGMKKALRTLLLLNFFRTAEMQDDLRDSSFADITGVMMFFLARYGYEIMDIHTVSVDDKGGVRASTGDPASITGVEFTFRKKDGLRLIRAIFFSADLSDSGLAKHPEFVSFIKSRKDPVTLLKSGSYLLGYYYFSTLRAHILSGSISILQDDAGIPYSYFKAPEWDLSLYGKYRVLEMFSDKLQPGFARAMKGKNVLPLPFSYGYGFLPHKSNLMYAVRKKSPKNR